MPVELNQIIAEMGETGLEMTRMNAAEAAAGNLSVFVRDLSGLDARFNLKKQVKLSIKAPALAGGWLVVSGTGRRLRDIGAAPEKNLCVLNIMPDGEQAIMHTGIDLRPTSEYDSHLLIHQDHVASRSLEYHAVVHVQPVYLTYLTHLMQYSETSHLNRRLMRWEPETILLLPEGVGVIPFRLLGTMEQAQSTLEAMRTYRLVVWQRHGTVSRSDQSLIKAADLVEYAETAAHFEYLNLALGHTEGGMSDEEIKSICALYGIKQNYF
jgi:rhamnulose-1-phosphate aldolase